MLAGILAIAMVAGTPVTVKAEEYTENNTEKMEENQLNDTENTVQDDSQEQTEIDNSDNVNEVQDGDGLQK